MEGLGREDGRVITGRGEVLEREERRRGGGQGAQKYAAGHAVS